MHTNHKHNVHEIHTFYIINLYHPSLKLRSKSPLKLRALEGLSKLPICGYNVVRSDGSTITGRDAEGEGLTIEIRIGLPVLAKIPRHCLPPGFRAFD